MNSNKCKDKCFKNGNVVIGSGAILKFNKCSGLDIPLVKEDAKYDVVLDKIKVCLPCSDKQDEECKKLKTIYVPRKQKIVDIGWVGVKSLVFSKHTIMSVNLYKDGIFERLPKCFKSTIVNGFSSIEYTEYHPIRINITVVLIVSIQIGTIAHSVTLLTYKVDKHGNTSLVHEGVEAEGGKKVINAFNIHEISHTFPMDVRNFDRFYFLLRSPIGAPRLPDNILILENEVTVKSKIIIWS